MKEIKTVSIDHTGGGGFSPVEKLHAPLKVMLINMEGEADLSIHEPIGIESVASRTLAENPNIRLEIYDTQPELAKTGKVDTDELAERVREFANQDCGSLLLGIGVPIFSYEYTRSLLIKLEQNPPDVPMTVVLGNTIPTYTDPKLIKKDFPYIKIVVGEGEETFSRITERMTEGKSVDDSLVYNPPDLNGYVLPYRALASVILELGGTAKVEASRGCNFGACTFCSRCLRSGKDYRTIPEEKVVRQVQELLDEFNINRFELTDEEAFGDVEATARLISAIKSADLPRVSFVASLRVNTLIRLKNQGLLDQLQEIGLEKVFLGAEGGSNEYLRQMVKGQTVEEIREAIGIVKEAGLDLELGLITFSWRMSFDMLKKNIEFLSEEDYMQYVVSLFNVLAVRAGTIDEKILRRYVIQGRIKGYDPDEKFSINLSSYQDVPFLDERVGEIYKRVSEFAKGDARVYYALKSVVRAASLPEELQEKVEEFYRSMKNIHLKLLRHEVGIERDENLTEKRRKLIEEIQDFFSTKQASGIVDMLLREVRIFLSEEEERTLAQQEQVGAALVFQDRNQRLLLTRRREDEFWEFPAGGIEKGEEVVDTAIREAKEELGVKEFKIVKHLPIFTEEEHKDSVVGKKSRLILHQLLASVDPGEIDILNADDEVVDTLWLSPEDILAGRVKTKENVKNIACMLSNQARE